MGGMCSSKLQSSAIVHPSKNDAPVTAAAAESNIDNTQGTAASSSPVTKEKKTSVIIKDNEHNLLVNAHPTEERWYNATSNTIEYTKGATCIQDECTCTQKCIDEKEDCVQCGHASVSHYSTRYGIRFFAPETLLKRGGFEIEAATGCVVRKNWIRHAPLPHTENIRLKLEWVNGYNNNRIVVNTHGHLVYPVGGVVVRYDPRHKTQTHLLEHTDRVVELAQNPVNKDIVATGQLSHVSPAGLAAPHICVWHTKDHHMWVLVNAHTASVRALAFSTCGNYLASVGGDDNYTLCVWKWQRFSKSASAPGIDLSKAHPGETIVNVTWRSDCELVTIGARHVYFWTFDAAGGLLKAQKGVLQGPKQPLQTFVSMVCVNEGPCLIGTRDGSIYIFMNLSCRSVIKPHSVCISSMHFANDRLLTGSVDGKVVLYNRKLEPKQVINFNGAVTSLAVITHKLYVGFASGQILLVENYYNAQCSVPRIIAQGHHTHTYNVHDAETRSNLLRGLDIISDVGFVSVGGDNKLYIWDYATHSTTKTLEAIASGTIYKKGATGVSASPDGTHFAVSMANGHVVFLDARQLVVVYIFKRLPANASATCVRFSPNSQMVAVGTNQGTVQILKRGKHIYTPVILLETTSKYSTVHAKQITAVDFSTDGDKVRFMNSLFELTELPVVPSFFPRPDTKEESKQEWASFSCFYHNDIFDPTCDGADVSAVDMHPTKAIVAVGTIFGMVRLFHWDAETRSICAFKTNAPFIAHSDAISSVKFSPDGTHLITTGLAENTVFLWKVRYD